MELISGSSLAGFPQLARDLGADPSAILDTVGLRVDDCGRPEAFILLRYAIHAVERAAVVTATADFGRQLAERQGIDILGPVGIAARTAPTFGAALAIFERFMAAYSPGIAVQLEPGPFLAWRAVVDPPIRHPQTTELSLGIALRVIQLLLGPSYRPVSVHFPHGPLTAPAEYGRYYGCAAYFDEPHAGFILRDADLDRPLAQRDDTDLHGGAIRQLTEVITDHATPTAQAVARLVAPLLPSGTVRIEVVAGQFGLHPKALQRRLAEEDTTFSAIVNQVRREIAERYLRDTDISLSHLTRQLGFAEQGVLTRACQRWFDASPSAHRIALRDNHTRLV